MAEAPFRRTGIHVETLGHRPAPSCLGQHSAHRAKGARSVQNRLPNSIYVYDMVVGEFIGKTTIDTYAH
jgi:hypothetical protein